MAWAGRNQHLRELLELLAVKMHFFNTLPLLIIMHKDYFECSAMHYNFTQV